MNATLIEERDIIMNSLLGTGYDYIIVGGGSAGCVIASRLIEQTDATVLLLEAGEHISYKQTVTDPAQWAGNIGAEQDYFYAYEAEPALNDRSLLLPQGKGIGGSGSINAMVWARGHKNDYDNWAKAGNTGWDYASVLPLFKKIESWEDGETDFHGGKGPVSIERSINLHKVASALIQAGIDYNIPFLSDASSADQPGVGQMVLNIYGGKRNDAYKGYLKPVKNSSKLTMLTGARVTRLNLNGSRCQGVDFLYHGEKYTIDADREVILSAGAINTPRILMLSGIGDEKELKALGITTRLSLPGVGTNLQDHPVLMGLCYETREPMGPVRNNMFGSMLYWKSSSVLPQPDLMIFPAQSNLVTRDVAAEYQIPDHAFCLIPSLLRVKSRGYLKMKTAQPDGPLEIRANFLTEQEDLEAIRAGLELSMQLAGQPSFEKLIRRQVSPAKGLKGEAMTNFIRNSCTSFFHPAGTCAMGRDKDAVVDAELQLHGISGLRIADASVMPAVTTGHTYAPTLMIAEFASQLITGR